MDRFSLGKRSDRSAGISKDENLDSMLGWTNIYLEHANRLLDLMIVDEAEKRRDVSNISYPCATRESPHCGDVLHRSAPRPASTMHLFRGLGYYTTKAQGANTSVQNFGYNLVGAPDWRILTCSECGHVQAFRVDHATKKRMVEREGKMRYAYNKQPKQDDPNTLASQPGR